MWRWAVLIAISVAMFGNYYAYDSIGPVADSLQRILGFTDTQIGTLNAIYSFPNIVMVLIGGIIVDRYGAARGDVRVRIHLHARRAHHRALAELFPVMAAGRLIFGLGAESMIVAITVIIGQWFIGAPARIRVRREPGDRPRRIGTVRTCRRRGSSRCTTWGGSRRCGSPSASRR